MIETLAAILIVVGVAFLVIAAVGVFRLGDPFLRMHASTKAGTLGAGLGSGHRPVALTAPDLDDGEPQALLHGGDPCVVTLPGRPPTPRGGATYGLGLRRFDRRG